jgi:multidrug efflux pump subunit AcrA (membrane-fusion protein)
VTRINGQWFAFVAESGEGGKGLVAKQRSLELGPVVGNNYTVVSGLKPGEKLIVGGIQKIRDGSPVQAGPAKAGHYQGGDKYQGHDEPTVVSAFRWTWTGGIA